MRVSAVNRGNPKGNVIVPAMPENEMVPPSLATRSRTAWRKDPGPHELVLTTKCMDPGGFVAVAGAYRKVAMIELSRSIETRSGFTLPAASPDHSAKE